MILATLVDTLAVLALSAATFGSPADTLEGVHYVVYRSDGTPARFVDIVSAAENSDALLIGETHDDPIAHALEYQLLEAMANAVGGNRSVILSLEMFESDVQYIIDEYLDDLVSETHFKRSVRPWGNYDTDYRPSVEFAKEHGLRVVAANAPRRYVSRVTSHGAESLVELSATAKSYLPPLPYALASTRYRAQWDTLMARSMAEMRAAMDSVKAATADSSQDSEDSDDGQVEDSGNGQVEDSDSTKAGGTAAAPMHGTPAGMGNALDSQSLWDASMAYSISRALMDEPGGLVVHFAGGFHVETGTGIPEHIERYRPGTPRIIVAIRPHDEIQEFDQEKFAGLGDFVILTDKSLPRTRR